MEIRSQEQSFNTSRSFFFRGNDESNSGRLKISITVEGTTTPDMVSKLEELALVTQLKAEEIVEGQAAPQQFKNEADKKDMLIDEWINQFGQNCEHLRSAGDSPSESEQ